MKTKKVPEVHCFQRWLLRERVNYIQLSIERSGVPQKQSVLETN